MDGLAAALDEVHVRVRPGVWIEWSDTEEGGCPSTDGFHLGPCLEMSTPDKITQL